MLSSSLVRITNDIAFFSEGQCCTYDWLKDFNGALLPFESDPRLFTDEFGRLRSLTVDAVSQRVDEHGAV